MGMVRLLGLGRCEGRVSAEIVQVESGRVRGQEECLGRLCVEDGSWINQVARVPAVDQQILQA